jgi:hypothetical protein
MKPLIFLFILLGALAYFLFGNSLHNYFVSDDFIWLLNAKNDHYADLFRYIIDAKGFFYRPFTEMYFFFMWRWFGVDPYAYHLFNILIHLFNSVVVYLLASSLLNRFYSDSRSRNVLLACVTSILFFIHPIHQENILWISAVTELFPAAFLLSALLLFVTRFIHHRATISAMILFYLLFILALMSHEYGVIFPILIFLADYFLTVDTTKVTALTKVIIVIASKKTMYIGMIITDFIYLLIRSQANAHWSGGDYSYNLVKLPFNIVGNLFGYLGLNIVGVPFIYFYQSLRNVMRDNLILSGILLLTLFAGTVYIIKISKRGDEDSFLSSQSVRLIWYLVLFFVVALLPFLGLGGIAERYLYLPSFAMLLLLSLFLYWTIRYFDVPVNQYQIWYFAIILLISILYSYSTKIDQNDWQLASNFVYNRLGEFRDNCSNFTEGETISRVSPPNRTGRAWVFQVGYQQGANVLCDKNITILLK